MKTPAAMSQCQRVTTQSAKVDVPATSGKSPQTIAARYAPFTPGGYHAHPMDLRRMRAHELEAVVRLWRRSRDASQPWLEARMAHTAEDDLRFFGGTIAKENDVWVAVEGEVLGFLAIAGDRLGWLYVEPVAWSKGVGSALLDKAKALSPAGLTLYTHQRNERARRFYERRGFRAVEFGTSPPPESEPDVLYCWQPLAR
jgi:GNAT superfamily N-acetyltransferase